MIGPKTNAMWLPRCFSGMPVHLMSFETVSFICWRLRSPLADMLAVVGCCWWITGCLRKVGVRLSMPGRHIGPDIGHTKEDLVQVRELFHMSLGPQNNCALLFAAATSLPACLYWAHFRKARPVLCAVFATNIYQTPPHTHTISHTQIHTHTMADQEYHREGVFRFLDLPPELCNRIYGFGFAFAQNEPITLMSGKEFGATRTSWSGCIVAADGDRGKKSLGLAYGLLLASRQLYTEAKDLLLCTPNVVWLCRRLDTVLTIYIATRT